MLNSEFLVSESELETITHEYEVISSNFLLIDINETTEMAFTLKKAVMDVTADAGIYFWLLDLDSICYKFTLARQLH